MTTTNPTPARPKPRPLWSVTDVSEYLGVPVKTIYNWRLEHAGPPCIRVGKHLRFVQDEVVAWVEARREKSA